MIPPIGTTAGMTRAGAGRPDGRNRPGVRARIRYRAASAGWIMECLAHRRTIDPAWSRDKAPATRMAPVQGGFCRIGCSGQRDGRG